MQNMHIIAWPTPTNRLMNDIEGVYDDNKMKHQYSQNHLMINTSIGTWLIMDRHFTEDTW